MWGLTFGGDVLCSLEASRAVARADNTGDDGGELIGEMFRALGDLLRKRGGDLIGARGGDLLRARCGDLLRARCGDLLRSR